MRCTSPLKFYPWQLYKNTPTELLNPAYFPLGYVELPCGKCLACRIGRSREWTLRIIHELESWECASFITLTYSSDYLPKNGTIVKSDLQKFFKRLRKRVFPIKYYACGEYGTIYGRPHYHAIVFGLSLSTAQSLLPEVWEFGLTHAGTVTADSARYVTGYIDKKYSGPLAEEVYTDHGLEIPFQLVSQGMGLRFALSDSDRLCTDLCTTLNGVTYGLPRYYLKKLPISKSAIRSRSFKALYDRYIKYDDGKHNLTDADADIERGRKQTALNLRTRLSMKSKGKL